MQSSGGFCWWYVDLVDDQGDGVVLIWSFGLPFLPESRAAHRPSERPALNVVVYRGGREEFYLLQELSAEDAQVEADGWRFGDTTIRLEQTEGELTLVASIDAVVPAQRHRLSGEVRVSGVPCVLPAAASSTGADAHVWEPRLVGCDATATLRWGDADADTLVLNGRGYFDSNASSTPLTSLGIGRWSWGRVALGERHIVYYQLEPESEADAEIAHVLSFGADGHARLLDNAELDWSDGQRSLYGPTHHRELQIRADGFAATVTAESLVDDGPFYLRTLVRAQCHHTGAHGRGVAERVVVPRIDVKWQRPFVRMRRHKLGRDGNSMWLPLFSGHRRGRVGRLVSQFWSGGATT